MKTSLVCIAKNEDHYIEEWINYHLKLGFDKVFVYLNNWNFDKQIKNVHYKKIDGEVKQLDAYHDFILNNNSKFDWAAFLDVDEFIILKKHKNIKEFIKDYEKYNSIAINWYMFGDNGLENVNDEYSVIKRFTKRAKVMDRHIKVIVKLSPKVKFLTPHHTNFQWVDSNYKIGSGPFNDDSKDDVVQINHYFSKTKEEYLKKIERGRADFVKPRPISDFDVYNLNQVEDINAFNFFFN